MANGKKTETDLISDEMSEQIIATTAKLVTEFGTQYVTVRKILNEMNISNRVFYNRFHNLDEVLQAVYLDLILKMRENLKAVPEDMDYFEYATHVVVKCMIDTYDMWRQFSQYSFEHSSLTEQNRLWWTGRITEILNKAKARRCPQRHQFRTARLLHVVHLPRRKCRRRFAKTFENRSGRVSESRL